jgi:SAM-dependent methyltransferase
METEPSRTVEDRLIELFQAFGIAQAHIAAGQLVVSDWLGLATGYPERVASLILMSPRPRSELTALASRLMVVAGDKGLGAQGPAKLLADLPSAAAHILRDYECLPWTDVIAERGAVIAPAVLHFLDSHPLPPALLPAGEGEVGGITYRIRGAGPPLVLMPLDLAPSQWEPLIPQLSEHYCTIAVGGPLVGAVSLLEARGRSSYLSVVRMLLDLTAIKPGEVVLEVGGGSGVVLRELARRTAGANRIIDVDINPYLLREAAELARREGLAERITFQQGSAEAIPLAADSVDAAFSMTVMEEGDAHRMLAELVRVTRPGGRIGAVVRSLDMPWWVNAPLSAALRAKMDSPGFITTAGADQAGCADASLYRRFSAAGLTNLTFLPQLVAVTPDIEPGRLGAFEAQIVAGLTTEEKAEWRVATATAKADGTFFIASPLHCAVGTKPA